MSAPLQVLCVSAQPVDLWGSAYGPFVVQLSATLEEAALELRSSAFDAVLLHMPTPAALGSLLQWPALSHAVLDSAVVVMSPEPDVHQVVPLLQKKKLLST